MQMVEIHHQVDGTLPDTREVKAHLHCLELRVLEEHPGGAEFQLALLPHRYGEAPPDPRTSARRLRSLPPWWTPSWQQSQGRAHTAGSLGLEEFTQLWQYWTGLFIGLHGLDSTLEGGPMGPVAGDSSMEMPGISWPSWKTNF